MNELEVRELSYFVAVAEELSFVRAAGRLGIAQPPLSKAIKQLETKLGVPLLERTTRHVALTAAGIVLLEQGRAALNAVEAARRRAQRAGQREPRLIVAVKPSGDVGPLQTIVAAYDAEPEMPPAEVTVCGWGEPAEMLRAGRADVALLRLPFDQTGLDFEPLVSEARVAVLSACHPLAARLSLRRVDLADEPIPSWQGGSDEVTSAYWAGLDAASLTHNPPDLERLRRTGPRPGPVVQDIAQLLEVVALGQAVAFLPESIAQRYTRPDVVHRPVADLSESTIVVAWPDDCRSRAVAAFVRVACDMATRIPNQLAALA